MGNPKKYYFYKFSNDEVQMCEVSDSTNMDIALKTIGDNEENLHIITDLYANNPTYRDEFQKYVNLLKIIPKYRKDKRRFRMKVSALKGQFLDSWLIEWSVLKRNHIQKMTELVKSVDWGLRNTDYQLWKYTSFKGKHRYMDFAKDYYVRTGKIPYTITNV